MSREQKILLVTGASSDVGQELISQIADKYELMIAHFNHNAALIEQLEKKFPQKIYKIQADLGNEQDVMRMIGEIKEKQYMPDHIVHLAAPRTGNERFHKMNYDKFETALEVSLKSIVMILQNFLPHMVRQKYGRIVFMLTSYCVGVPPRYQSYYVTSKYALLGLMKSLASEYNTKGITVNGVSPEMIETKFLSDLPELIVEESASRSPLKRNLQVQDAVPAFQYLLSDEADAVTGQNLAITGGIR